MKNILQLLLLTASIFMVSCDGGDTDPNIDHLCYFQPQVAAGSNVGNCPIDASFSFLDEDGIGSSYSNNGGTMPIIALEKNKCYDAWIITNSGGNVECGQMIFEIKVGDETCFSHATDINGRPEVSTAPLSPHLSFCLDDECSCPDITVH